METLIPFDHMASVTNDDRLDERRYTSKGE